MRASEAPLNVGWLVLGALALTLGACGPDTIWRASGLDAENAGWLMNVWAPSEDVVFAVGGSPDAGAVWMESGGEWRELTVPDGVSLVNWAYGFGPDDVFFVTNGGNTLHWDGDALEARPTSTDEDLWGVWGATPDDVWAVGGTGDAMSEAVIFHWDGSAWAQSTLPTLDRGSNALFKVWGTGADNVYAVGDLGIIMHWDGSAWTEESFGARDDLVSLWGTGPDNIVAIGGRSNAVYAYFDGSEWRGDFLEGGMHPGMNGIWMREPGVAHISGFRGRAFSITVPGFEVIEEATQLEERTFHAIYGVGDRLFAVGGNIGLPAPFTGIAFERGLAGGE